MSLSYLPADLPENWQTGQILSPTGTEVGLSEQHGHNYLMKAVNEAHRACNLLLEENQKLRDELESRLNSVQQEINRQGALLEALQAEMSKKADTEAVLAELAKKANGQFTFYHRLADLGIAPGTETPEKL